MSTNAILVLDLVALDVLPLVFLIQWQRLRFQGGATASATTMEISSSILLKSSENKLRYQILATQREYLGKYSATM